MQHWEIIIWFLIIALVYASVGFGGGSSYLAILSFYALPFAEMKLTALACNVIVVTGGTIIFSQKKLLDWKKAAPLIVSGVIMAFAGARMKIAPDTFFVILGLSLITAAFLLWIKPLWNINYAVSKKSNYIIDIVVGGAIGFLSGLVGIGGGIFLAPALNLMRWDTPKKIAAVASLYILVNSLSGIAGQMSQLPADVKYTRIGLLCTAVLVGGQFGSRLGAIKFDQLAVRRLTAALVFIAGVEVLYKHIVWFK
jgi:uncharacterized membrane protein YfcA